MTEVDTKNTQTIRNCLFCGKELMDKQIRRDGKFCGRECHYKYQREHVDEVNLNFSEKIIRFLLLLIIPVVIIFIFEWYLLTLTESMPDTYSGYLPIILAIFLLIVFLFLFYSLYWLIAKIASYLGNIEWERVLIQEYKGLAWYMKLATFFFILLSLQAAYPVFFPKVSLTPVEDTLGVVKGDNQSVVTYGVVEVRPALLVLPGFTNHQDIVLGSEIDYIKPEHQTPLMNFKQLEDKRTIKVYVNTDGWRYDALTDRIEYRYSQRIEYEVHHNNITYLYSDKFENKENKTIYFDYIHAYNYEDFPISIREFTVFIEPNTQAWSKLYTVAKEGKRFHPEMCALNLTSCRSGARIGNNTNKGYLELSDFVAEKLVITFNRLTDENIEPQGDQERILAFVPYNQP